MNVAIKKFVFIIKLQRPSSMSKYVKMSSSAKQHDSMLSIIQVC